MTIENLEFRHIKLGELETRLGENEEGTFSGYACRWDVIDSYETSFASGTFATATRDQNLPLLWMHSPDHPVGVFSWREDAEGLYIEGRYDDTAAGRDARIRAQSSAPGLSVGFVRRGVDSKDQSRITAAELKEVSQITLGFASQPGAELMAVRKAAEIMAEMDDQEPVDEPEVTPEETEDTPEDQEETPEKEDRVKVNCSGCGKSLRNIRCADCVTETKSDDSETETRREEIENRYAGLIAGSYEERVEQVRSALGSWVNEHYPRSDNGDRTVWVYPVATFTDSVVGRVIDYGSDAERQAFRMSYAVVDGQISLGEPKEVEIKTTVTVEGMQSAERVEEVEIVERKAKNEDVSDADAPSEEEVKNIPELTDDDLTDEPLPEDADEDDDSEERADTTPGKGKGGRRLHDYWVRGEGAKKWKTWTELYNHLKKYIKSPELAKATAARWFHDRYKFWPGDKKNRDSATQRRLEMRIKLAQNKKR